MKAFLFFLVTSATTGSALGADPAAFHGMALFGHGHTYISHLPMFHRPHDYQGIAEVSLGQTQGIYASDAAAHPNETLYTLAPDKNFVLPPLFQSLGSFSATLYRGHFERGGVPIAEHISVQLTRALYFQKFSPGATAPSQPVFFAVGYPGELFLVHKIVAAPDFDQIVAAIGMAAIGTPFTAAGTLSAGDKVGGLSVQKNLYLEFDDLK